MIRYLLLGFLRDGQPRHGYALMKDAKSKLRLVASSGSFYRELRMLERGGLVTVQDAGEPGDGRRTSYVITQEGRRAFLAWLRSPSPDLRSPEDDLSARALFFRDTSGPEGDQLLQRWQDRLWLECKILERERNELLATSEDRASTSIQELLLTRRIARTAADLDFLSSLRERVACAIVESEVPHAVVQSAAKTTGASPRQRKTVG